MEANGSPALTSSPLLRLPGELRNLIYEYVLDEAMHFCIHGMLHECSIKSQRSMPPLLQTRRQIRTEATSIWFSGAVFQFHNLRNLGVWLRALSPRHRNLIRTMKKWNAQRSWDGLEADLLLARKLLRGLGMLNASRAMVVGCISDASGIARPQGAARWFRGPGDVLNGGPVKCEAIDTGEST